ncbi:hypothetical protein [Streptomyces sp. NPDC056983]|uniref:hypothetical protein n=1 Tax=Streptomyces sp. NPDC056983 TaxID=3345987 RepID=UPI0036286BA0
MKIVVQVKLMPEAEQAAALRSTLRTVNDLACWVSQVAFARGVPRSVGSSVSTSQCILLAWREDVTGGLSSRPTAKPS